MYCKVVRRGGEIEAERSGRMEVTMSNPTSDINTRSLSSGGSQFLGFHSRLQPLGVQNASADREAPSFETLPSLTFLGLVTLIGASQLRLMPYDVRVPR